MVRISKPLVLLLATVVFGACEKDDQAEEPRPIFRASQPGYIPPDATPPPPPRPSEQTVMLDSVEHRYFPICGDRRYDITPRYISHVWQVQDLELSRSILAPTEVDRLNGVEWVAEIRFRYTIARSVNGNPNTKWQDVGEYFSSGDNHVVRLRKINGFYETKVTTWPWARFPDFKSDEEKWFNCTRS